jgi:endonuclease/exonuclease/phosphatase (EEP) superfamily protein YafD
VEFNQPLKWICLILLLANLIYLFWFIYPYSFLSKKMLPQEKDENPEYRIKLLTINVYQHNERFDLTLERITEVNPDVVYLLETDKNWMDAVQTLKKEYPYFIEVPQDNTYGLLFYSKFPMTNSSINYWIDEEIPSIMVDLKIKDEIVRIYGIHPTPPVPQENPESTERDAEILIVGKKSDEFKGPSIVFGDLNDVAWSHTTRLFLRISKMLDPRIGRGMFNTFHAKYWFAKWPLDHFFVSSHFRLIEMKVEKSVESDHYPISIDLSIQHERKDKELNASQEDLEEAQEIIEEARK